MPRRPRLALALTAVALLAGAHPGLAQVEMRSVVVPADGAVVIPPRSAPRLAARPAGVGIGVPIPLAGAGGGPVLLPDTGLGLAGPVAGFVLPAIAGALLGGSIAGSRGGSAPARTR